MSPALNGCSPHVDGPTSFGNFDLVNRVKLDYTDVVFSKWQSRVTGLSIVHSDYDAPLVQGYFVVGTEIFDDSGCPHTLEHLVFMGSEKYPYKGIIDHLANRGFSNGTNAWTDTDHTAYTVSTAGEQGFLQLLPIYVDHILYPTMTKAGYVTEVHHIDPKGQDSGVVYSEMQGRENTSGDLMALRHQRLLNPPGSAYRSETGGLMEALRVLSVEQIREYHGTYYVPHNLTLMVCGKLASGTESLLAVAQEQIEPVLIAHKQNRGPRPEGWRRPFVETPSANRVPIAKTVKETVDFPEQDESVGDIVLGFSGPPPNAYLERQALDMLGTYLTSSPVAPLNKEYVETDCPLCTYIYFSEDTRATIVDLPVYVGSIPTEHLETFDEKLKVSLQRIVKEGIDMERMAMIINRDERQFRSKLESSKGEVFSSTAIDYFLYGPQDGSDMKEALDFINRYAVLRKWSSHQWTALLSKYYVEPPCVVVRGKPSAAMAERLEKDEKARLAEQVKKLGPAGIAHHAKELEDAKAENEREIPQEVLTAFPVPDVKSIAWIPVQSVQEKAFARREPARDNAELARHIERDGKPLRFFVQYDHVKSDFVTVRGLFSLAKLPNELRPYISPYLTALFALPVVRENGEELTHEELINRLDDETVSYGSELSFHGLSQDMLCVSIKVETALYAEAVAWLKDVVYGSRFTKERLQVTLAKIQQNLPELKRDASTMLSTLSNEQVYNENSTPLANGVLAQMEFIPRISQQLHEEPEAVIAKFEQINHYLTDPSIVRFAVAGDVLAVSHPRSVWEQHFGKRLTSGQLAPVPWASDTLSKLGKKPARKAVVMSLPTVESSYVQHTAKGIHGFEHPDYPAVRVAMEVLNATESYLWRYIRGSGLAYGAHVGVDLEAGHVSFSLYRSSNSMDAFKQAAKVLKDVVEGKVAFDDTTLDAAKSGIVYGVTKNVSTASRAATTSFINQALKGVSQNHNVELLERYQAITKADVLHALKRYFLPLFDPATSVAAVVTSLGKTDEIVEGLTEAGFDVTRRTLEIDPDELEDGESMSEGEDGQSDDSDRR